MVARGGFEPPQAASKAAVLTITQPGNQKTASIIAYIHPNILMFLPLLTDCPLPVISSSACESAKRFAPLGEERMCFRVPPFMGHSFGALVSVSSARDCQRQSTASCVEMSCPHSGRPVQHILSSPTPLTFSRAKRGFEQFWPERQELHTIGASDKACADSQNGTDRTDKHPIRLGR